MAVQYSDALATFILASGYTAWAAGDLLEIRKGAAPGPNNAATGTQVVEITLPASPMNAPASRQTTKNGTWSANALAANTGDGALYYRIRKAGDANGADSTQKREEGTVGALGSGLDMILNQATRDITSGQPVVVNSFTKSL